MSTCSLDSLIVFEIHALLHLPLWEILFPDRKQVCMDEIHTAVDPSQVYRQWNNYYFAIVEADK